MWSTVQFFRPPRVILMKILHLMSSQIFNLKLLRIVAAPRMIKKEMMMMMVGFGIQIVSERKVIKNNLSQQIKNHFYFREMSAKLFLFGIQEFQIKY